MNLKVSTFLARRYFIGAYLLVLIASTMFFTGCSRSFDKARYKNPTQAQRVVKGPDGKSHEVFGVASWYGKPYHGRITASGEKYNMRKMTAAHKTLPFNTVVRVIDVQTGRSVKVRITDRGPFVKGRIIDLSRRAAQRMDMINEGIRPVHLEIVRWGDGKRVRR